MENPFPLIDGLTRQEFMISYLGMMWFVTSLVGSLIGSLLVVIMGPTNGQVSCALR